MTDLVFDCIGASADRYSAEPTLRLRLRIAETTGTPIHAIVLRCQIRLDVHRRRYSPQEAERLHDLFGETARWGETLKPLQLMSVSTMVPSFEGSTEVDVQVPCSYDLDVATTKYFHGLDDGEIPFVLMFTGTIFSKRGDGFAVELVPWHKETTYSVPVATWREVIDSHFPNSGWVRLSRDVLEQLRQYRSTQGHMSWDQTIEQLLKVARTGGDHE
ncbi:MAG: DUF6084 family protein [Egibacteraceae bacterium]